MPRRYPAEFRRKVLDLVAAGRPVAQIAHDLQISAQTTYTWRRQQLIDSGQLPGMTSTDHAELAIWFYPKDQKPAYRTRLGIFGATEKTSARL